MVEKMTQLQETMTLHVARTAEERARFLAERDTERRQWSAEMADAIAKVRNEYDADLADLARTRDAWHRFSFFLAF